MAQGAAAAPYVQDAALRLAGLDLAAELRRLRRWPSPGPGYRRYLENRFRTAFDLEGIPLRMRFRRGPAGLIAAAGSGPPPPRLHFRARAVAQLG